MLNRYFKIGYMLFGCVLISSLSLQAQNSLYKSLEVGASVNYNTLHYESDGDFLNDIIYYDYGFQVHVLVNHTFSKKFKLQSGLEYFFYTYNLEDRTEETDFNGELTGNYYVLYTAESFHTSYITLPIRVQYYPFSHSQLYFTAGPELSYKIGYSNGVQKINYYSENGELLPQGNYFESEYNVPELANDFIISAIAGIGYNLSSVIPIKIELKAKHSITPYLNRENFIKSWIRGFSLSLSYNI